MQNLRYTIFCFIFIAVLRSMDVIFNDMAFIQATTDRSHTQLHAQPISKEIHQTAIFSDQFQMVNLTQSKLYQQAFMSRKRLSENESNEIQMILHEQEILEAEWHNKSKSEDETRKGKITEYSFLYNSDFNPSICSTNTEEETTSIIFNYYKGPAINLERQIEMSYNQKNATISSIWINVFNSPMEEEYRNVYNKMKAKYNQSNTTLHYTMSTFNYKFHGRFMLSQMATSKYLLIIDDDRRLPEGMVNNFLQHMYNETAVYGVAGHQRMPKENDIPFLWHVKKTQVDVLCGMWFFKKAWLDAYFHEPFGTLFTGEDIHLTYTLQKYLGIPSYIIPPPPGGVALDEKQHSATSTTRSYTVRSQLYSHYIQHGMKMTLQNLSPIDTIIYVHTLSDALKIRKKIQQCQDNPEDNILCHHGKIMLGFSGNHASETPIYEKIGYDISKLTNSSFTMDITIKIGLPIYSLNMRSSFGDVEETEKPTAVVAADLITTLTGILNNFRPSTFIYATQNPTIQKSITIAIESFLTTSNS